MVHAIALTLVRLVITQRRLLEWETAAAQAVRATGLLQEGMRSFFVEMIASPVAALGLLAATGAARPGALPWHFRSSPCGRWRPPAGTGSVDRSCRAGGSSFLRTALF